MQIKQYSFVENAITELAIQYKEVPDVSTKEGFKACKEQAKAVGVYRINLEAKRKEIKAPAMKKCKEIDSEAKRIQALIAEIENPLKLAYQKVEEENKRIEAVRVSGIKDRIEGMNVFISMARTGTAETISEWIEQVDEIDCSEDFDEFTKDAITTKNKVLDALNIELRRAVQQEIDTKKNKELQDELEELRAMKAENEAAKENLGKVEPKADEIVVDNDESVLNDIRKHLKYVCHINDHTVNLVIGALQSTNLITINY